MFMGFNVSKIIDAWATSINPTDNERKLADARWSICDTCTSKVETLKNKKWSYLCGDCGCPLNKKIFTKTFGECPRGKWDNVDSEYFNIKKQKTLI